MSPAIPDGAKDTVGVLIEDLGIRLNRGLTLHEKEIHLDAPYYLYLTDKQATSYLSATREEIYQTDLEHPLEEIIHKNRAAVSSHTHDTVHFYDLGPGYPNKSFVLLEQLLETRRHTRYFAIDISPYFLALTRDFICRRGIQVTTLHCRFEDAHKFLPSYEPSDREYTRFFFIGLTFNNYSISDMIHVLSSLCRYNDIVIIAAQFFDGLTPESVSRPYRTSAAESFNFLTLDLLGLNNDSFRYFVDFYDSCIHMGFTATSDVPRPNGYVPKNTKLFTSFSYRYTKSYLETHMHPFKCEAIFGDERPDIGVIKLRKVE